MDNLLSFSWKYLFKVPKLPKPRYPSNANSRQRDKGKFELFNQTQPKPHLRSLGKVQECGLTQ